MARRPDTRLTRSNLGFLLAKASQHWNNLLYAGFCEEDFGHVRPSFGSVLIPLFEEDGLRIGELGRRVKLSKQTMTTLVRLVEKAGLARRRTDPRDNRAARVYLTAEAKRFRPIAEKVLVKLEQKAERVEGSKSLNDVRKWLIRFAQL